MRRFELEVWRPVGPERVRADPVELAVLLTAEPETAELTVSRAGWVMTVRAVAESPSLRPVRTLPRAVHRAWRPREAAATPDDDPRAGMLHPLSLLSGDLEAWTEVFADYELLQPFPQLVREVYPRGEGKPEGVGQHPRCGVARPAALGLGLGLGSRRSLRVLRQRLG